MSFTTDPNQLIIAALIFVLGLLIGIFLTAGGRRKWKSRYRQEVDRREAIERDHAERTKDWDEREKEWRERDSLRAAAIKSGRDPEDDRPL
jgi:predicted histidine transporter YuiF (NhaC family)